MKLIDTHTHLYLPEFDGDRDEAVRRALENEVGIMLLPNIDVGSVDPMLGSVRKYPDICFPMLGLHPTSVKEDYESQLEKLEALFGLHRFIAVGEIGIDLYWDKTFIKEQLRAFRRQLKFALEHKLPAVIHSRDAFPEVFSVLEEFRGSGLTGVLHAFTGTAEDANRAIGLGFRLGIGGIVTFKNSGLDRVVKEIGLEQLILETDSPYLAPVPYRGKRNESSYLCIINKKLGEIFELSGEETAAVTYSNSVKLFNL